MPNSLGVEIAKMLAARGVETVFGIPGVHNLELYRGLEGAGLRHVLARHEQGAGFMADGYARASGRPGVAFAISGPGLTNMLTPLGQAYSDSVPMLALSSGLPREALGQGRGMLHEMRDQRAAAETVTAWSRTALSAEGAYRLVDLALAEMARGRPRPRHVELPLDLLAEAAPPAPEQARAVVAERTPRPLPGEILDMLAAARRPLFILGGGAAGAALAFRELFARYPAASFLTYAGRGILPSDSPLCFGSFLARPGSASEIARADLVVATGTELSEVDLWRDELGHDAPLIRVDVDPATLTGEPGALALEMDATEFAEALLMSNLPDESSWNPDDISAARARWRAEVAAERPGVVETADALRAALPKETLIYSDMTQIAYGAKEVWDMAAPRLWHHPFGFGTLGYALPAAIGGKMARPHAPAIALAGDYGFQYTLNELATASDLDLSLPIVVWDNGGLGEIADSMQSAQMAPVAVKAEGPDLQQLAKAFRTEYALPERPSDLAPILRNALGKGRPTIVHLTPGMARAN